RRGGTHAGGGFVHAEVSDDGWRVARDELREPITVTGIDAMELGAAQAPAGRHEVDTHDVAGPRTLLDQLRDPRAELAAHPCDQHPFHRVHSITPSAPA